MGSDANRLSARSNSNNSRSHYRPTLGTHFDPSRNVLRNTGSRLAVDRATINDLKAISLQRLQKRLLDDLQTASILNCDLLLTKNWAPTTHPLLRRGLTLIRPVTNSPGPVERAVRLRSRSSRKPASNRESRITKCRAGDVSHVGKQPKIPANCAR